MPDTSGIAPPLDRLIYPVGLAMTPSGRYLVALNSNFDLKYNAGTLVAIDVSDLRGALAETQSAWEADDDGDGAPSPYLYGPSVNGSEYYLEETNDKLIISDQTVRLGAFASDLKTTPAGDRLIIPVRGSKSILIVDAQENGISCGQAENRHRNCDTTHQIRSSDLPIEPYEVTSFEVQAQDGSQKTITYGAATHLAEGQVSLFKIEEREGDAVTFEPQFISAASNVAPGASGIAANPLSRDVDPARSGEIYVTGRRDSSPDIAVLRLLTGSAGQINNNPYFNVVGRISLGKELYSATDARSIAISRDGRRGYMVTRKPAALIAVDLEARQMVGETVVGAEPSIVRLYEHDGGTPDDPSDDRTYAFVLCFSIDRIYIIDTQTMNLVTTRATGAGPQAMAIDSERRRIYIANFRESTISILVIDDSSEPRFDYLRVSDLGTTGQEADEQAIVKIGRPRLPAKHN
jgi:DNA-binding beta-propeller fold protein YncE